MIQNVHQYWVSSFSGTIIVQRCITLLLLPAKELRKSEPIVILFNYCWGGAIPVIYC